MPNPFPMLQVNVQNIKYKNAMKVDPIHIHRLGLCSIMIRLSVSGVMSMLSAFHIVYLVRDCIFQPSEASAVSTN